MNGRKPTKRFWQSYKALYGNGEAPTPAKPKKKRNNEEAQEQKKYIKWFSETLEPLDYRCFHPRNGGSLKSAAEGANFKLMGVKAGVLDIIVPVAINPYHGLVIEFKRIDHDLTSLSPAQKDWFAWFKRQGWSAHVAFGCEHAKKITLEYFNVK